MAYRFLNPAPQLFTIDGKVLAGGSLTFYAAGTSTMQDTYTAADLATKNPNPLSLDASGVPTADVWLSGNYRVVAKDASGATRWTRDPINEPAALPDPAGHSGQFLTTNGSTFSYAPIDQLPDPSGQNGKYVQVVSGGYVLANGPAVPTLPPLPSGGISQSSGKIVIGGALIQWGTGSAPSSGGHTTATTINFPTAFSAPPVVMVNTDLSQLTSSGFLGVGRATSVGKTSFNAGFDINVDNSASAWNITSSVPFSWLAVGLA